jgi:hypothetical protein
MKSYFSNVLSIEYFVDDHPFLSSIFENALISQLLDGHSEFMPMLLLQDRRVRNVQYLAIVQRVVAGSLQLGQHSLDLIKDSLQGV